MLGFQKGFLHAFASVISSFYLTGFIVVVTVVRLSRFKLIEKKWFPLKIEFPVGYEQVMENNGELRSKLRIKGDSFNETILSIYYHDFMMILPLHPGRSFIESTRLAYIEEKLFLKNDESCYVVRVYDDDENSPSIRLLIKPKLSGTTYISGKYPIVGVFKFPETDFTPENNSLKTLEFKEWAYIKPRQFFR
jgi:hypothetical protein